MLLCPGPDITRELAACRGPPGAAGLRPPGPAGVLEVGGELLAELRGVRGVQVDLIAGALEREPDGLLGRAAGQVVLQDEGYFLAACSPSQGQRPRGELLRLDQGELLDLRAWPTHAMARRATVEYI